MLLTDKKLGERIFIGDFIAIKVIKTQGRRVRFAIQAPREISVCNQKMYDQRYCADISNAPKSITEPLEEENFDIHNSGTLVIDCETDNPLRLGSDGTISIENIRKNRATLGIDTPQELKVSFKKQELSTIISAPEISTQASSMRFVKDSGLSDRRAESLDTLKAKSKFHDLTK